ncbi:MAG TPA: hypothetical protein VJ754_10475 [Anaerolineae bacterium]|nr:hypothetical protein [Anaerolineae bacterium]
MIPLNLPVSLVSLIGVLVTLHIFGVLSRRLGAVTKMKPYYRGFYLAMALVVLSIGVALLPQPAAESDRLLHGLAYTLPLLLAGLISLVVAYRYWGWLFRERIK